MVGTHRRTMGGIRAVVDGYEQGGLFERFPLVYVATHREGRVWRKAAVALVGWLAVAVQLMRLDAPLVHVHLASRASFWRKSVVCLLARLAGRPYLLHLHGGGFATFYFEECRPAARRIVRGVLGRADLVLALTDEWREVLLRICPAARVEVLRNGVALPAEHEPGGAVTAAPRILFLGQVSEDKGAFDLLRAFAQIAGRFPQARLVCAGPGALAEAEALARQLGVADRVELPGWLDGARKRRELASATVFALPSRAEGLPMALLEAMSWSLPAIASSVGGIPRLLQHEVSGLLIAPGDLAGLSAGLATLIADPARGMRMGGAARDFVAAGYSLEASVEQLAAVYRRFGLCERPQGELPACRASVRGAPERA